MTFKYPDQYGRMPAYPVRPWLDGRFIILGPKETRTETWTQEVTAVISEITFFSGNSDVLLTEFNVVRGVELHEGMCRDTICRICGRILVDFEEYIQRGLHWFPMHNQSVHAGMLMSVTFQNLLDIEQSAAIAMRGYSWYDRPTR